MTSPDLIHWTDEGLKLFPDTIFDSHGAYSGSALPLSDKELFLFYTGNTRGENNFGMLIKMVPFTHKQATSVNLIPHCLEHQKAILIISVTQ
jgi:sucrose-6-phosphate hydrolase SacC (GH32 family)